MQITTNFIRLPYLPVALWPCLKSTNVFIFVMPVAISHIRKKKKSRIHALVNFWGTHLASNTKYPNLTFTCCPFSPFSNWVQNQDSEKIIHYSFFNLVDETDIEQISCYVAGFFSFLFCFGFILKNERINDTHILLWACIRELVSLRRKVLEQTVCN